MNLNEFLGYASFYAPDNAEIARLPVYSIDSAPGSWQAIDNIVSIEPLQYSLEAYLKIINYVEENLPILSSASKANFTNSVRTSVIESVNAWGILNREIVSGIIDYTQVPLISGGYGGDYYGGFKYSDKIYPIFVKWQGAYAMAEVQLSDSLEIFTPNFTKSPFNLITSLDLHNTPSITIPINFYRSSEPGVIDSSPIELARGESSDPLTFTIVYDDGTFEEYAGDIEYSGEGLGTAYIIDNNVITIADETRRSSATITAKPVDYPELFTLIPLAITNPNGIYDEGGTTGPDGGSIGPGGTGSFGKNEVSDSIDIPSGSVAGDATSTGLITRYLVNSSYLDAIGDWLWSTDLGLQIAKTVISAIYGNPAESVISLMSYPFNISTLSGVTSRNQNLVWGNHDSGIGAIALTSQAATVDWGTITLEEYWGNFLDYEPHTKIELYLPWGTGFVSIDPNMCLPGSIRVVTNIDFSKGSCIHNVIGNNNVVIGTYAGQCSQQIPIMSNDYASKMAGVVVSATALAVAGAAGGAASTAGAKAEQSYGATHSMPFGDPKGIAAYKAGIAEAVREAEAPYRATQKTAARLAAGSSVAAFKRSGIIARNGSFTDGSAALGAQYPYIILSRPSQSVPEQYGSHYGYPSNIYTRLNNIRGYTEVGEIHLDGIAGTDAEIAELDSILKGGVIF